MRNEKNISTFATKSTFMKRLFVIILLIFTFLQTDAQSYGYIYPKREVRAVWLTTIGGLDWPHGYAQSVSSIQKQQDDLKKLLDLYQRAGINTILLQTRIRGTVIYPSQYEPWDGCLSGIHGKSPNYDALQFAIDETHKRGMELHAWVVTIPVGKWNALGCRRLRSRYPSLIRRIGEEGFMNPENPQTAQYLANICKEITDNYDIDGIHLDYIRYPETWDIKVSRSKGREYITNIVREIHDQVKAEKPWVKMSCSPIGKHDDLSRYWSYGWNAYTRVCQDAQGWLHNGLMDELFPMMYFKGDQFFPFAIDWAEQRHGKIVAPGLGIYFMAATEKNWKIDTIVQEMHVLRQYSLGHAYFRGRFFTDNTKGIYTFASEQFDKYPALVPAMTWEHSVPPMAPTKIYLNQTTSTLHWSGAINTGHSPYLLYNVYASRTYPVDINDARNLIAQRVQKPYIRLVNTKDFYYAVTAMDRYGNESEAAQYGTQTGTTVTKAHATLLTCNGYCLQIPQIMLQGDTQYFTIETLTGTVVATFRQHGNSIDVSRIANGMYTLRTLNRKGISHRLGYFVVKRRP